MKVDSVLAFTIVTAACILPCATLANARPPPAGSGDRDLCRALADLVRGTRMEILYDPRLCRGRRVRQPVRGLPITQALSAALAGTGLDQRQTPDGAFVLFVRSTPPPPFTDAAEEGAINDILVTGRRTQNADIRRTENDIQPYKVATRTDVERAHSDNVDQNR